MIHELFIGHDSLRLKQTRPIVWTAYFSGVQMIETRTETSIAGLKPSMKDLKGIEEAPVGEGVVVQVKADGESSSAWLHLVSSVLHLVATLGPLFQPPELRRPGMHSQQLGQDAEGLSSPERVRGGVQGKGLQFS